MNLRFEFGSPEVEEGDERASQGGMSRLSGV